ncbi:glycerol 3-phosphate dehydrogenase (NAD(P)+) [Desulfotomaculum arcticum]|uniref:Glycerol-3-phosphate dehydrogenase [NAD(P)+] n=1 Tax=Desulfotruncus arcticus DSM 17038 TaxID=1121424 RepID=A0A1I2N088_9FIRM|nr:NAD(P)H-dependent glycerol-3-phosphate dehydrogenase [Desulfotruncus arcticus]SFF94976.1 glycerol 3-phosphate dehydrogenase (NAD(P)+) [Desulfotomaculum arcticum] [Desulfotruncus arcticus DSM 17038]
MGENGKVAVLGAGSWGTALAAHLADKGYRVGLWSRRPDQVEQLNTCRENSRYLPGIKLPENMLATGDLEHVLSAAEYVVFSVPSHSFRQVLSDALAYIDENALVINTAKGIEENSLQRLSEVFGEVAGNGRAKNYAVLSGPSHAEEVALKMPAAVVVAAASDEPATRGQDLFMTETFRVYTNPDIIGVELGGALKNIIALGTGIVDGFIGSDNTKAAFITRGLAEITRLGIAMHANPLTFAGLAGLGDLIVTCTSKHSRNRRAGIEIGRGNSLEQALAGVNMVVEGVRTTRATHGLAKAWGVEMPITEQMYQVLFKGKNPKTAVVNLMNRDKTNEVEEVALAKIKWWIEKDDKSPAF